MKEQLGQDNNQPVLRRGVAKTLLLMTGRAVEAGGCLLPTELKPDSITKAAFDVYEGNEEGTLSEVIEEVTGSPSGIHPALLGELVTQAVAKHAELLGLSAEEALV